MTEGKKRAAAYVISCMAIFGVTTFTMWGFDPVSWDARERLGFAAILLLFPMWIAAFPGLADD